MKLPVALIAAAFATGAALTALLLAFQPLVLSTPAACLNGTAQSLVSPGTADELVAALAFARNSIDVQMYVFTSSELKDALVQAARRGVCVRLILEPRIDSNAATAAFLVANGVQVRWASREFANTHSKLALIDGKTVLVGSINWSWHALYANREAALLVENPRLAQEFGSVFEEDWAIAQIASA